VLGGSLVMMLAVEKEVGLEHRLVEVLALELVKSKELGLELEMAQVLVYRLGEGMGSE